MMGLKHIYNRCGILMLALFALLCGCVKIETAEPDAIRQEILFSSPVLSNATKANVSGELTTYPIGEHFAVFALYTPQNFTSWTATDAVTYVDWVDVGYDSAKNGWTSGAGASGLTYYWPSSGKLTFAAYSPSSCTEDMTGFSYGQTGFVFEDFAVKSDPADQYDLLYAPRAMNRTGSSMDAGATYYGTDINFRHALSCIEFKARNGSNYSGSEIYIYNIEVLNAYQSGDFAENIDKSDESVYASSAQWTGQSRENSAGYKVVASDVNQLVTEEAAKVDGARALLLMPQDFKHSSGNNVKIRIRFKDNGVDKTEEIDLVTGYDSDNDDIGDTYFNDGTNPITGWEPGMKYTYTITFGKYKIFFTPNVTSWVDMSSIPPVYI